MLTELATYCVGTGLQNTLLKEVTERRGRRQRHLLDDLKGKRDTGN